MRPDGRRAPDLATLDVRVGFNKHFPGCGARHDSIVSFGDIDRCLNNEDLARSSIWRHIKAIDRVTERFCFCARLEMLKCEL